MEHQSLFLINIRLKKCVIKLNYPSTIKYVLDQYKTQEMCIRAVNTCSFVFDSVPNEYKTQEMCNNAVDNNLSTIKDVSDWWKAQELCDKAADDYSIAWEFFPD